MYISQMVSMVTVSMSHDLLTFIFCEISNLTLQSARRLQVQLKDKWCNMRNVCVT